MQNEFKFSFESLEVYQVSVEFTSAIYQTTKRYPNEEKFGITSQLRRAAVSVSSNIAEGNGRSSKKEQARFMEIAYSSLLEVICQLDISENLNYINREEKKKLRVTGLRICKMLRKLQSSYLKIANRK